MNDINHYGHTIALHYQAYRPPLHTLILNHAIPSNSSFVTGVDVGCGTGYSAKALTKYCSHVYGVEPSYEMLSRAIPTKKVTYKEGSAEDIPLPNRVADIVTYAGVLYYADLKRAALELRRVCNKKAVVLVYDFSVIYQPFIDFHKLTINKSNISYDHKCNFGGIVGFKNDKAKVARVDFAAQADQLAHLLLSEPQLYESYAKLYGTQEPYEKLTNELYKQKDVFVVEADIFYTMYTMPDYK